MSKFDGHICIAGKNKCSIDFVKYIKKKINKNSILILPNKSDKGRDGWQPSLRKFAKIRKMKIVQLDQLYKLKNLIFISIEYETLVDTRKFKSKKLYNFHFSLLPKYRGCHTNFLQIYNGEKFSGVTLHKINNGIDEGPIIGSKKFLIRKNANAFDNYQNLMKNSLILLKQNLRRLIKNQYVIKNQNLNKGSYFPRKFINYEKMKVFDIKKIKRSDFNKIKAFIFPPLQLPIVNNRTVRQIKFVNKKYKIFYD